MKNAPSFIFENISALNMPLVWSVAAQCRENKVGHADKLFDSWDKSDILRKLLLLEKRIVDDNIDSKDFCLRSH